MTQTEKTIWKRLNVNQTALTTTSSRLTGLEKEFSDNIFSLRCWFGGET